jgi:hypothetical protein
MLISGIGSGMGELMGLPISGWRAGGGAMGAIKKAVSKVADATKVVNCKGKELDVISIE